MALMLRLAKFAALVLLTACSDDEVTLYEGKWIDVAGIGRERADTCVGTFDYVDAYAGVLAAEFGLDGPIGSFIWYTPDEYDARRPCPWLYPSACAKEDTAHSPILPQAHEMVHIANHRAGPCPNALAEGIAVYYSTDVNDGHNLNVDVLRNRLAAPSASVPITEYEMLGRFAAFLIEHHGLQAVLDVCAVAGPDANGADLSAAMQSILGATSEELITALSQEPSHCNDFFDYRSKVFACGVAAAAPSLGTIVDGRLEAHIEFGCEQPNTAGPFEEGTFYGQIVRTMSLDIPTDGHYWFVLHDEAEEWITVPEGITLVVSQCGSCGDGFRVPADWVWTTPQLGDFDAGRYSVEIGLPEDYVGTVLLTIDES
jgi:hypothetical protein